MGMTDLGNILFIVIAVCLFITLMFPPMYYLLAGQNSDNTNTTYFTEGGVECRYLQTYIGGLFSNTDYTLSECVDGKTYYNQRTYSTKKEDVLK